MIAYVQSQFYNSTGNALSVAQGASQGILRVPANKHGRVYRVAIKQSAGANVAFSFYVLDTDTTVSGAPDKELCKLANKVDVTSGNVGFLSSDAGMAYRNKTNDAAFYILVTLGSGAASLLKFDVCVTWSAAES